MLLGAGLLAAFGSKVINIEAAGPLAVVTAAFVSSCYWMKDGWTIGKVILNLIISLGLKINFCLFRRIQYPRRLTSSG